MSKINHPYSKSEILYLKEFFHCTDLRQLSKDLFAITNIRRSEQSLRKIACQIGLSKVNVWTKVENDFLIANYRSLTNKQIAAELLKINPRPRTIDSVYSQATKLKLRKNNYWLSEEIEYLTSLIGEYPIRKLTRNYNIWAKRNNFHRRSEYQIRTRIKFQGESLRLKYSSEYLISKDLALLLGCVEKTARKHINRYYEEKGRKPSERCLFIKREALRQYFFEHQNVLEQHQKTLNMHWLMEILKSPNQR